MALRAFGVSDRGRVRPANEDCFAIHEDLGLCIVADGMGGHNAGEVAARMEVDAVSHDFRLAVRSGLESACLQPSWPFGFDAKVSHAANVLRTSILQASLRILETAVTTDDCAGMGTTVVAACVVGNRLTVGHVGDSRLYLLSGNTLRLLTTDDSWMAVMLAQEPSVDPLIYRHHPMRHALTNVVGRRTPMDVHIAEERLSEGDLLLLTTDGVHGVVEDGRLHELAVRGGEPAAIAESIIEAALAQGTRDNCTAIVARYYPTNL